MIGTETGNTIGESALKCSVCGHDWPKDRFNPECSSPTICFRCRSRSVSIGIPHQEHFHNTTDKAAQRKAMAEARQQGHDPIPAWTTQYAGPASLPKVTTDAK